MNLEQARRAAGTLEDVFTNAGDAVVIDELWPLSPGCWAARTTGHGDVGIYYWPISELTAVEDI